jgi:hypothetical protein
MPYTPGQPALVPTLLPLTHIHSGIGVGVGVGAGVAVNVFELEPPQLESTTARNVSMSDGNILLTKISSDAVLNLVL